MNYWIFIILGCLIGVVVIFLVVGSILDRKKIKKNKIAQAKHEESISHSRGEVAIWVQLIRQENQKLLNEFVPSVGKFKMADVKSKARQAFEQLFKSKSFRLFSDGEDNENDVKNLKDLANLNSNVWESKAKKFLNSFAKEIKDLSQDDYQEFTKVTEKKVQKIYYEST